jgi:membrane protease YdiL (CAAX protease family)
VRQTPPEVATAALSFIAFWLIIVLVILIAGQFHPAIRGFRKQMLVQWKPALVIAGLFVLGMGTGGRGFLNPYAIAIFCQALIGLAIASSIEGYEPLPVTSAVVRRKNILRQVILAITISVLVIVPALLIGTIGLDIGRQIFGETNYTREAANTLPPNKWLTFFLLLSGSGIAEETPYRLVLLSFIWKVTKRKWLAIVLSALVFGAYHLTPLSGMYLIFRQFPVSQFLASTLIGLVWGYLFIKRGYETTVLGHTFSNWLPMVIFSG